MRFPLVLLLATALAASGCAERDDDDVRDDDGALLGGVVAPGGTYRSVVRVDDNCTGTLVGPRLILTASHCLRTPLGQVSPSFAVGRDLTVEVRTAAGALEMVRVPIARAEIHPRLTEVCAAENGGKGCSGPSAAAKRDAPDLAVIEIGRALPHAVVMPISQRGAAVGESVAPAGFGCFDRIAGRSDDSLRIGSTFVIDPAEVAHPGSGITAPVAQQLSSVYLYTEGPALYGHNVASLCQGDSGGPLFRESSKGPELLGVASSYTFQAGVTEAAATSWFSRTDKDAKNDVLAWLRRNGATIR